MWLNKYLFINRNLAQIHTSWRFGMMEQNTMLFEEALPFSYIFKRVQVEPYSFRKSSLRFCQRTSKG